MLASGQIEQMATLILLPVLVVALAYDLKSHRIPNWLSATAMCAGLALHFHLLGFKGLQSSLGGAATGLVLFLPFYIKRAMGAGDVKLLAAIGALLGFPTVLIAVASCLIAGGFFGLAVFVLLGGFSEFATRYISMAKTFTATGQVLYLAPQHNSAAGRKFPYSTAIACGTLATLLLTDRLGPDTMQLLIHLYRELIG